MKKLFFAFFLLVPFWAFSQVEYDTVTVMDPEDFTEYTTQPIDTGAIQFFSKKAGAWFRINPQTLKEWIEIDSVSFYGDTLRIYQGGSATPFKVEIVSGGGSLVDGDYGDITVSGSGSIWMIDDGVVGPDELASTAVTPGSYTLASITVDQDGRITAASSGSEVDGDISNEGSLVVLAGSATTSIIQSNTSGSTDITLEAGANITLAETGNTITITAAGDGTGTDDQTLSWNGGTGELSIEDGNTVDLDGRYLQSEVDGDISNEGSLVVLAGAATTSIIQSNTSGSTDITFEVTGGLAISETGNTITLDGSGLGDNLGNHTATEDLNMAQWDITNVDTLQIKGQTATNWKLWIEESGDSFMFSHGEDETNVLLQIGDGGTLRIADEYTLPNTDGPTGYVLKTDGAGNVSWQQDNTGGAGANGEANVGINLGTGDGVYAGKADTTLQFKSLVEGGIVSISSTSTEITISATEVDGDISNEGILSVGGGLDTTSLIQSNTSGASDIILAVTGGLAISENGSTITFDGSGLISSDDQTLSWNGGTGELSIEDGNTVDLDGRYLESEVDGSVTNEAWTIDGDDIDTELISNQTVLFAGGGIASTDYDPATNTLTITATEVDGSVTNEGALTVGAGSSTTSLIQSNTSGSTAITLEAGTNITLAESGNTITITAAGTGHTIRDDGVSMTQRDALNFTSTGTINAVLTDDSDNNETEVALSIATGSVGATQLASTAVTPGSYTLSSITVDADGRITAASSGSEVDGSITNEGALTVGAGASNTSLIQSNTSGSTAVTLQAGTNITLAEAGNTITITAAGDGTGTDDQTLSWNGGTGEMSIEDGNTVDLDGRYLQTEVDGSVTNEAWTIDATGGDTEVVSNQTILFAGGGIASTSYSSATNTLTITATEVDGSVTNEAWTIDGDSGDAELIGSQTVLFTGSGIASTDYDAATNTLTITATEVDGSVTNEAWTIDGDSGDTELIGSQTVLFAGGGIASTSYNAATNTLTITATEVDGDISNEGSLTVGAGAANTSLIQSNTSGSTAVTIQAGSNITLSESGNTITISAAGVGLGDNLGDHVATASLNLDENPIDSVSVLEFFNTNGDAETWNLLEKNTGDFWIQPSGGSTPAISFSDNAAGSVVKISNTWTLPTNTGVDGMVLTSDGAGGSAWEDIPGVTDESYGEMSITTPTSISITPGVPAKSTGTVIGDARNFTHTDGRLTYEGPTSMFYVNYNAGIDASISGSEVELWIYLNGSAVSESYEFEYIEGADVNESMNTGCLITLDSLDYLEAFYDASENLTLFVNSSNFRVFKIGSSIAVGSGENNTGENIGAGAGIYAGMNGTALQFKTLLEGGIVSISNDADEITISATEVDGDVTNEGSLTVGAGSSTTSLIQSNTSGSTAVTLQAGANIVLSESGNTITIAATGDGTPGDGDYGDITVSGSGTVWSIDAGVVGATELASTAVTPGSYTLANITVDSDGRITAASNGTEVDGSTTNEAWTIDGDDAETELISNQTVLFTGGGIVSTDYDAATNTLTITAAEVDGSVTNEAWTIDGDGGDTELIGSQTILFAGSGIASTSYSSATNTLTITATEVDGDVTNEGSLTVGAGSSTTSLIQSNTSGSTAITLEAGTNITLAESGNTITITAASGADGNGIFDVTNEGGVTAIGSMEFGKTLTIDPNNYDFQMGTAALNNTGEFEFYALTADGQDVTIFAGSRDSSSINSGEGFPMDAFLSSFGPSDGIIGVNYEFIGNVFNVAAFGDTMLVTSYPGSEMYYYWANLPRDPQDTISQMLVLDWATDRVYTRDVETLNDNLGNHEAEQDLNMNLWDIQEIDTLEIGQGTDVYKFWIEESGSDLYLTYGQDETSGTYPLRISTAGGVRFGGLDGYWMPTDAGTDGYVLTTDGSGTASWAAVSGGDNLGNHSATMTLDMNGETIFDAGSISLDDLDSDGNKWTIFESVSGGDLWFASTNQSTPALSLADDKSVKISDAWTLPTSAGTNGYVLTSNGSGGSSWSAASGGAKHVKGVSIQSPTSGENVSLFYVDHAITITRISDVVQGTSPSVSYNIRHASTRNSGTPNSVFSSSRTVTSLSGATTTSFSDATIPANSWVWLITSSASGTITEFNATIQYTED